MKITLITVGKIKEKYFTDAIAEYAKRLSRYCKLEIVEVADEKTPDGASESLENQIKEKEGERHQHKTGGIQYPVCAEYRVGVCPPLRDHVLLLYGLVGHYGFPQRDLRPATGGEHRPDRSGH